MSLSVLHQGLNSLEVKVVGLSACREELVLRRPSVGFPKIELLGVPIIRITVDVGPFLGP